ncbi:MAG: HAD-IA family hydrolase, partial [Rhodocyclaceae bacterium]|nr:HAD-IA family hydrolase [Rhodocyclaceae bacterium]
RHYTEVNGLYTAVYPGVLEGLTLLKTRGLPLAVITNKAAVFVNPLLDRMGLLPFFDVVVGGDTLPRAKPDPMPVVWACGRLGVSPADAVLIGDSVNDAKAGRAAGCRVLLVPYGYNEGRDVRELEADAIVGSVLEAAHRIAIP